MTAKGLNASDCVGKPPGVMVTETSAGAASGTIPVAPISGGIYRFPIAQPAK